MDKEQKKLIHQKEQHKEREAVIGLQNEKLKAVSWLNSHEIRKPVASILALAQLMKSSDSEEEKSELLELLHRCAVDLDDIILEINAEASGRSAVKKS
jgi:signal transduction histidine kinase